MLLPARIVIFTVCLLTVYALPNVKPWSVKSANSLLSDTSFSKAAKACKKELNEEMDNIKAQLDDETLTCFTTAGENVNNTDIPYIKEANLVRANMAALEQSVQNCTSMTDDVDFMQCTIDSHNNDLNFLNNAYTMSLIGINEAKTWQELTQCTNAALNEAAQNTTQAINNYNDCMAKIFDPNEN